MRRISLIVGVGLALAGSALAEAQNDMRASRAALDACIARIRVPDSHECDGLMQLYLSDTQRVEAARSRQIQAGQKLMCYSAAMAAQGGYSRLPQSDAQQLGNAALACS